MKPVYKGILISMVVLCLLAGIVIATISYSYHKRARQAERDYIEQTKICDTLSRITDQPELELKGFEKEEMEGLTFQLLRNGELIHDTLITNLRDTFGRYTLRIPYAEFLKTDTIVVVVKDQACFYISGYRYDAYLGYGMFGYMGHSTCRLSRKCVVNGTLCEYGGVLDKSEALPVSSRNGYIVTCK